MTQALYALTGAEHATVLAALRGYQIELQRLGEPPANLADIASSAGTLEPLGVEMVDDLVDTLNHSLTFGEVVNLLGTSDDPAVDAALELITNDNITFDGKPIVARGEGGAQVMCWFWVPDADEEDGEWEDES